MSQEISALIDVDEAARLFGVSRQRMYGLARSGLVPMVRLGRTIRFSVNALHALIEAGGRALEGEGGWRTR